jgi:hypothetical protein
MKYNPRYIAYSRANGNTPNRQLLEDRDDWPGGCMTGFQLWISEAATVFCTLPGFNNWGNRGTIVYEKEFDTFLNDCADASEALIPTI